MGTPAVNGYSGIPRTGNEAIIKKFYTIEQRLRRLETTTPVQLALQQQIDELRARIDAAGIG